MSMTACVGEWSNWERWSVGFIHWCQSSWSLVNRRQRSPTGRWRLECSHSTDEQRSTPGTCPQRHKPCSPAAVANTTSLQSTHRTAVGRTLQHSALWESRYLNVLTRLTPISFTVLLHFDYWQCWGRVNSNEFNSRVNSLTVSSEFELNHSRDCELWVWFNS